MEQLPTSEFFIVHKSISPYEDSKLLEFVTEVQAYLNAGWHTTSSMEAITIGAIVVLYQPLQRYFADIPKTSAPTPEPVIGESENVLLQEAGSLRSVSPSVDESSVEPSPVVEPTTVVEPVAVPAVPAIVTAVEHVVESLLPEPVKSIPGVESIVEPAIESVIADVIEHVEEHKNNENKASTQE